MLLITGLEFIKVKSDKKLKYTYRVKITMQHSTPQPCPHPIETFLSFDPKKAARDELDFIQKPPVEYRHQVTGAQAMWILESIRRFSKDWMVGEREVDRAVDSMMKSFERQGERV